MNKSKGNIINYLIFYKQTPCFYVFSSFASNSLHISLPHIRKTKTLHKGRVNHICIRLFHEPQRDAFSVEIDTDDPDRHMLMKF